MELQWTQEAAADLERIADYLFEHIPDHAARLVRALYDAPATLLTFPNRGRLGKKEGTRELVMFTPDASFVLNGTRRPTTGVDVRTQSVRYTVGREFICADHSYRPR